ncbi:MarR family winged helix-turn-helix transcriptional regulator [Spelaeicoccus albus]|uniref:DNA-binding MarR family transcriptional regulator n=1 Tax=Spelaeicoccus albus TaxID=1280376 RepID=A0A7Z0A997_9MICO|nr:MarR family transcriptional regulator [Spelaeicoccus albus]NYI65910.1 DNA-binding MarR family transcriptional regulator [Spelaeicoccus albus]
MNDPSPRKLSAIQLANELRIASNRLVRRLRTEKADHEVTDGQYAVLAFIDRRGPQTLTSLSEYEGVKPPSMNRTVNCLVDAGYAVRDPDPDDGRQVRITLTAPGADIVRDTRRRRDAWLATQVRRLDADQRRTLAEAAAILKEVAAK